jgi:regulator of cell morphogenesis and NO signaling
VIITHMTTVADITSAIPSSARVLQRLGIDVCCGAQAPLAFACEQQGLSLAAVTAAIEAAAAGPDLADHDWAGESLHRLIDYIVDSFHIPLRNELPRLESMATRVRRVHGAAASHLARLDAIVADLAVGLQSHMRKEEMVLFPAIRAIELGRPGLVIATSIAAMQHEHGRAGATLSELRDLTGGYRAPDAACETYRALYRGLAGMEAQMHVHVHLENDILFPRALALAHVS